MIRVALLAPLRTSLYSRILAHLLAVEPGVEFTTAVYRTPWTYKRIRGELMRDGPRLLRKAYKKLVLADDAYAPAADDETLRSLAETHGVKASGLDQLARQHNFKLHCVKDHNDQRSQAVLREARPDVIVFSGGGLIRKAILDIPSQGILNAHMGILPPYRGMDVVEWPVLECHEDKSPLIGLTVHFMDRGVDTGPIILTREVPLKSGDDFASLRVRFEPVMVRALMDAVRRLRDGACEPQPQQQADGRQYFLMHPRLMEHAQAKLQRIVAVRSSSSS